jgi:hypothetical protein
VIGDRNGGGSAAVGHRCSWEAGDLRFFLIQITVAEKAAAFRPINSIKVSS